MAHTLLHAGVEIQILTKGVDDGGILTVQPAGDVITATEFNTWIDTGVLPNVALGRLPEYKKQQWINRLNELRCLEVLTTDQLVTNHSHVWIGTMPAGLSAVEKTKALDKCAKIVTDLKLQNISDIANARVDGFDTQWGRGDLKDFTVLCVGGLDLHTIHEIQHRNIDVSSFGADKLPGGEKGMSHKINWRSILPLADVEKVDNKSLVVPVNRKSLQLSTVIEEIPGRKFI